MGTPSRRAPPDIARLLPYRSNSRRNSSCYARLPGAYSELDAPDTKLLPILFEPLPDALSADHEIYTSPFMLLHLVHAVCVEAILAKSR